MTKTLNPFRPRSRLLQLLGDELIGNNRLAIFELIKNAYDADAGSATVTLRLDDEEPSIAVVDDGTGMDSSIIKNVWLVPGIDHRAIQRSEGIRSRKFGRLPLGEKGLGRFAVHKLGEHIELTTRARGKKECSVVIEWGDLTQKPFLDQAKVAVTTRPPRRFKGQTGTQIMISKLRQRVWTRGDVRRLYRQIASINSPFAKAGDFQATLEVPGREEWIEDLPSTQEIASSAPWKFSFRLAPIVDSDEARLDWEYVFRPIPGLKVEGRATAGEDVRLQIPPSREALEEKQKKSVLVEAETLDGIGPVEGDFYVFDRDREFTSRMPHFQLVSDFLDESGGVRVYRDGIRVYNYGEPGDDWLGLDLRRVNTPTRRISRNLIVGEVRLGLEHSAGLTEKTNREGFIDNEQTARLTRVVLGALAVLETERGIDKDRLRSLIHPPSDPTGNKIQKPIEELRAAIATHDLVNELEPYVSKLEQDYTQMEEIFLSAGMSGLNLAVVFHEVERGVRALHESILEGNSGPSVSNQARELMKLLDGFSTLLRRGDKSRHTARSLLISARDFSATRIRFHKVKLFMPDLEKDSPGFEAKFSFPLVVGALSNLIDNALYWLRIRWPDKTPEMKPTSRQLYVGITDELEHPSIVVADNGPGFTDPPQSVVRPFFTRRPNGMGLGLYYATLAMELNGGELVFPSADVIDLPKGFDGAVVALSFPGVSK